MATKVIKKESTHFDPSKDDSIFPQFRLSQLGVGVLEVEGQAWSSYKLDETLFAHKITVHDDTDRTGAWGPVIFQGSLQDLINFIKEAQG